MKKAIFLPCLGLLAIMTWAFKPADIAGLIRTSEGIVFVTQAAQMSDADANTIFNILTGYGTDAGYLKFTDGAVTRTYGTGTISLTAMQELNQAVGADLGSGGPYAEGVFVFKKLLFKKKQKEVTALEEEAIRSSAMTSEINDRLAPILARYE